MVFCFLVDLLERLGAGVYYFLSIISSSQNIAGNLTALGMGIAKSLLI